MKILTKLFATATLLSVASLAHADPLLCSSGAAYEGSLDESDVTWEGSDADDCYGAVDGNDSASAVGDAFGGIWEELTKADDIGDSPVTSTGSYMGVDFELTSDNGTSGDWTLSWAENTAGALPLTLDFTVGIKGADSYGLWFFDDITFASDPNTGTGTWSISWLNNGGNNPNISHFTLYVREGTTTVAEPATLGLLGLSMLGLGYARRRRTAS